MAVTDSRFQKLFQALTARERGILVLRSMKEGTPEDPSIRQAMPLHQYAEFNRSIDAMNTANRRFAFLITLIKKEVEKLELKLDLYFCLRLWQAHLAEISVAASSLAREPITRKNHARRLQESDREFVGVRQLGFDLAERRRAWRDDELEEQGLAGQLVVKSEAWTRLSGAAETDLRAAVAVGELEGRGSGKALRIRFGSYLSWLGQPPAAYPAWAGGYEVLPDEDAVLVAAGRETLEHLRKTLEAPLLSGFFGRSEDYPGLTLTKFIEVIEARLVQHALACWQGLREVEVVIEEVGAEYFEGEDPLKPILRRDIEAAKESLPRSPARLAFS